MVLNDDYDNYDDYISLWPIDASMRSLMSSDWYYLALWSWDGASMAVGLYDGS